eukprot:COSAG04_NODE_784_length_10316_cov_32.065088_3_plen_447_part_00
MAARPKRELSGGAAAKGGKKPYVGAGASRRLSAGDAAVEGSAWDECDRQQRHDRRVSGAGKNVGVGDRITWDGGSLPGGVVSGGGEVKSVTDKGLMVLPDAKRKQIPIPLHAVNQIVRRAPPAVQPELSGSEGEGSGSDDDHLQAAKEAPKERKRRRGAAIATGAALAPAAAKSGVEDVVSGEEHRLVQAELARLKSQISSKKHRDKMAGDAEETEDEEEKEDPTQPLAEMEIPIKVKGVVPDNYRDLAVKMGVDYDLPGHKVFAMLRESIEAMGGEAAETIDSDSAASKLYTHCLVETDLLLRLDQARRMAEARRQDIPELDSCSEGEDSSDDEDEAPAARPSRRRTRAPREIVSEYPDDASLEAELTERRQRCEREEARYEAAVTDQLTFIDQLDYKPERDAPKPEEHDVGPVATEEEINDAANDGGFACSYFWAGVDGTTQGR